MNKLDSLVPLLSSGSSTVQLNAALALGAIVSNIGERPRFLRNGATERLTVMLTAGNLRIDGILYALGELSEDAATCGALASPHEPWRSARAWLIQRVSASASDLDLRRRCAFILRRCPQNMRP
jgi:hypothetical protein